MASGVPVVGAAAGGIPDLIRDGDTSFLVPVGDEDAYVGRLEQLKDAAFRQKMSEAGRAEAEKWGWEAATSVLRNVQYEMAIQCVHGRGGSGLPSPFALALTISLRARTGTSGSAASAATARPGRGSSGASSSTRCSGPGSG
jgi:sulfoquinovosyltransferase